MARDYVAEIPWARIQHRLDNHRGHRYTAYEGKDAIGFLRYAKEWPKPGVIIIHELVVEPEYKSRGVGVALLYRLHKDNPEYLINPGVPNDESLEFIRQIWESEPRVSKHAHLYPEVADQLGVNRDNTQAG